MDKQQTIFRVVKNKDNPYVIMDKRPINRNDLSWRAKGILSYILSKPDNWRIHLSDLEKHATDGRDSTRAGLRELQETLYIIKAQRRNSKGEILEHTWLVFEQPFDPKEPQYIPSEYTIDTTYIEAIYGKPVYGSPFTGKPTNGKTHKWSKPNMVQPDTINNDLKEFKDLKINKEDSKGNPQNETTTEEIYKMDTPAGKRLFSIKSLIWQEIWKTDPAAYKKLIEQLTPIAIRDGVLYIESDPEIMFELEDRFGATLKNLAKGYNLSLVIHPEGEPLNV